MSIWHRKAQAEGEYFHAAFPRPDPTPPKREPKPKGVRQKTYVVLQKSFKSDPHRPNVKVIAVKLTEEAAQSVVDQIPGTYIERHIASKTRYQR